VQAQVYVMGQYRGTHEVADDSLVGLLARWAAGESVEDAMAGALHAMAGAVATLNQSGRAQEIARAETDAAYDKREGA
jgi:hypothetical protein